MLTTPQQDNIKIALPKGRLLTTTACLLKTIGLEFDNYSAKTRFYRLQSPSLPNLSAKIFQEKDIPIQVAIGNYDLGVCGLDWIEELITKYPSSALLKITDLEYGKGNLYVAASRYGNISSLREVSIAQHNWRIVTEYPNLAESLALSLRLRRFRIFPVWGAAAVYPPENADLVLLQAKDEKELQTQSLIPLKTLLPTNAFLIANRESWQTKNVSRVIAYFSRKDEMKVRPWLQIKPQPYSRLNSFKPDLNTEKVWLALPDGHQQEPTAEFLSKAGLKLQGYSGRKLSHRPKCKFDWVNIKVIRPQDMPQQVATGNFDLAITGKDWFLDHLYRFPSSPVIELAELGFGKVKVVAVVSQDLPAHTIDQLKKLQANKQLPLRVASEYINIADKYLRDNHVSQYRVIPTWGASEAFLPEDADLLIENTQTGKTLAQHNLRIIDTLFQSVACLIGNKDSLESPVKRQKISSLVKTFCQAAGTV